jgi:hypothetical protein
VSWRSPGLIGWDGWLSCLMIMIACSYELLAVDDELVAAWLFFPG